MVIGILPIAPGKLCQWRWLGPVGRDRKTLQLVSDKLSHRFQTSYHQGACHHLLCFSPCKCCTLDTYHFALQAFKLCLAGWRVRANHTRRLITMTGAALETAMERYGKIVSLNSLRVSSSGRATWRRGVKRKESLQLRLWNLNSTSSIERSDFYQSARSGNERECKQTLLTISCRR